MAHSPLPASLSFMADPTPAGTSGRGASRPSAVDAAVSPPSKPLLHPRPATSGLRARLLASWQTTQRKRISGAGMYMMRGDGRERTGVCRCPLLFLLISSLLLYPSPDLWDFAAILVLGLISYGSEWFGEGACIERECKGRERPQAFPHQPCHSFSSICLSLLPPLRPHLPTRRRRLGGRHPVVGGPGMV